MTTKIKVQHLNQSVTGEMFLNYFLFDEVSIEHLKSLTNLPVGKSLTNLVYKVTKYDTEESQSKEAVKLLHKLFEFKSKRFVEMISESDRENFYDFFDKNNLDPFHFLVSGQELKNKFVQNKELSKEMIQFIKRNYFNAFTEIPFDTMEIHKNKYKKMVKHYSYTV